MSNSVCAARWRWTARAWRWARPRSRVGRPPRRPSTSPPASDAPRPRRITVPFFDNYHAPADALLSTAMHDRGMYLCEERDKNVFFSLFRISIFRSGLAVEKERTYAKEINANLTWSHNCVQRKVRLWPDFDSSDVITSWILRRESYSIIVLFLSFNSSYLSVLKI